MVCYNNVTLSVQKPLVVGGAIHTREESVASPTIKSKTFWLHAPSGTSSSQFHTSHALHDLLELPESRDLIYLYTVDLKVSSITALYAFVSFNADLYPSKLSKMIQ